MGVFRFFRFITQKYPECLIKLNGTYESCTPPQSKGIYTDWLEFDLNSVFHPVAQKLYSYGTSTQSNTRISLLKPTLNKQISQQDIPEKVLFSEICKRLQNIINIIKPQKGIYFAIDGVAGVSKQSQQRKRRFKSAQENTDNNEKKFDSNVISCGTLFMERLSKYIDIFIQKQMENNPQWKNLNIIFNNQRVIGEGEHKSIHHMKQNPQYSYTIVSPDADLIFLSMGLNNPKIYIFRENIFDDMAAAFFMVSIEVFKKSVLTELKLNDITNKQLTIEDFIIYCFFIGNDFLPQIPSININNQGIENIFALYPIIIKEHGFISQKQNNNYTINKKAMKQLLLELSKQEHQMIINNIKKNKTKWPDKLLMKYTSYSPHKSITIDLENYKKEYYQQKFNGIDTKEISHEYLKGILFVTKYYLDKIPSYTWAYPYFYAPYFKELYEHIDSFDENMTFEESEPLTPLEQLLSIVPGKCSYLLPEPLRFLSTSAESPIIDMFPINFEIDLEGKKNEYECTILLPHIDPERLRDAFNEHKHKLSEYDTQRNKPGKILTYYYDNKNQLIKMLSEPTN